MKVFKKRKVKLKFKLILLACFLVYTGFAIYSQQINITYLQNQKNELTEQCEQAEADLSRITNQSKFMNTDKYIENTAREKFGLTYEGEIIMEPEN